MPSACEEDFADNDDELPQVVQLNPGDLSQEEFEKLTTNTESLTEEDKDSGLTEDGRIMFRKPTKSKRQIGEISELNKSSKKQKAQQIDTEVTDEEKSKRQENKKEKCHGKKVKMNKKMLLSFNEDEIDEDS